MSPVATVAFLDVITTLGGMRAHLICLFALQKLATSTFCLVKSGTLYAFCINVAKINDEEKSSKTITMLITVNNSEESPACS